MPKSSALLYPLLPLVLLAVSACSPMQMKPSAPCLPCTQQETPKPAEPPLQKADWADLPGWTADDPAPAFAAFITSCKSLQKQAQWRTACATAQQVEAQDGSALRAWFEAHLRPWALVNADGSRTGLVTGYYEPVLKGSRSKKAAYATPVFAPPEDLISVELGELYPELKHMRLRGRLEGNRLVPYYSRNEWSKQESKRSHEALLWLDDPMDFFFMQVQGSGQVQLDDGSSVRLNYADQNGHPYHSIGRWLIDQGELKADQASMQGIKAWAKAHPRRLQELLNANPSLVFFRMLPVEGDGPPGAMGLPLTPERSIAVDPRHVPLGAPVWLATTEPNSERPLQRLMLAQDTGGAIRGVVRADFYWGSGNAAGSQAGKMRQQGRMWVLMPRAYEPTAAKLQTKESPR